MKVTDWQAIARNLAQISPEATAAFNRIVAAHTTDDAPREVFTRQEILGALDFDLLGCPGLRAYLELLDADVQAIRATVMPRSTPTTIPNLAPNFQ